MALLTPFSNVSWCIVRGPKGTTNIRAGQFRVWMRAWNPSCFINPSVSSTVAHGIEILEFWHEHLKGWSQNAINATVKKLTYPREKFDDRQANAIPLPFICKMWYIPLLLPLRHGLSLQNAICDMHGALHKLGNSIFLFPCGVYRVLWPNPSFDYNYDKLLI